MTRVKLSMEYSIENVSFKPKFLSFVSLDDTSHEVCGAYEILLVLRFSCYELCVTLYQSFSHVCMV